MDATDLATLAVHAGREDFIELGVHAPPLDLSSTYPVPDPDAATVGLDLMVAGARPAGNPVYARLHNPTVARFEDALARLEGAESAVAYASGMAAMTAALFVAAQEGRHVVAVRPLYGSTDHLLACKLLGLDVTFTSPDGVADAVRPDTSLVILETPANPTLDLADIRAVADAAGDVPLLVDSTFATPVLQRPLAHGATLVLHSATKFLGGHGDVIAGVIATDEATACKLRQVRVLTGALLHPLAAFLLLRGLPTLPLRVERAQSTASELARRLAGHPTVARVLYPGLDGADPERLVGRQMSGPGSIVSFELPTAEAAKALMRGLSLITPAVSLGSTDSLIQHPAGLTHRVVSADARASMGIGDGLLRLSVGLESMEALWTDLSVGLALADSVGDEGDGVPAASHVPPLTATS
jgi:methionine-gamma-lyase